MSRFRAQFQSGALSSGQGEEIGIPTPAGSPGLCVSSFYFFPKDLFIHFRERGGGKGEDLKQTPC